MFSLRRWLKQRFPQVARRHRPRRCQPQLESLEDRRLLAIYTVDTNSDLPIMGKLTLREAIQSSNASGGVLDTINFSIGNGVFVIEPAGQALPPIQDSVILDGFAPPMFPAQKIHLDGLSAGPVASGLVINAANTVIKGMTIIRFEASGIFVNGNKATLQGNYIGIDTNDVPALGNKADGIVIASSDCTVGGKLTNAKEANVIAANLNNGISIVGMMIERNKVTGNYIGTTPTDPGGGLGNKGDGVFISALNNTVGGTSPDDRNIISGNVGNGVQISGLGLSGNKVQGNYIGTDSTGSLKRANSLNGILVTSDSDRNSVGGTATTPGTAPGNLISGNGLAGVRIESGGAAKNLVQGNLIGTKLNGKEALGNDGGGVVIVNAPRNTIGDITAVPGTGAGNVISGNNKGDGIQITGAKATENTILGNLIGTDNMGSSALPNSSGVSILDGASDNTVGGAAPLSGNVISGNAVDGVTINGGLIISRRAAQLA